MPYTKEEQLKTVKPKKDLSESEKTKFFSWIKENKGCAICGAFPEVHHITNKSIKGIRRLHSRVIPLCFNHHSAQSEFLSIHNATDKFYNEVMRLEELLKQSKNLYLEYVR